MLITLHNFEEEISATIVDRGWEYFIADAIKRVSNENNMWHAVVLGSEEYEVTVELKDEIVVKSSCTCPYDWGPLCKHRIALLYALREIEEHTENHSEKIDVITELQKVLKKLAHEELVSIIIDYVGKNERIRNKILVKYGSEDPSQCGPFLRRLFDSVSDKEGLISSKKINSLRSKLHEILGEAESDFDSGEYEKALSASEPLIDVLIEKLDSSDDAEGVLGGVIENAFDILYAISEKDLAGPLQKRIYTWCLTKFKKGEYAGWDWHWDLIYLAINTADEEGFKTLLHLLNREVTKESIIGEYEEETKLRAIIAIYERMGLSEKAQEVFIKNLHLPAFRKERLSELFNQGDHQEVKKLALEGIQRDNNWESLIIDWKDWLLKVAMREKDVEDILEYAEPLFFSSKNMKYYNILKEHTPEELWPRKVEEILQVLNEFPWLNNTFAEVCVAEKLFRRLFDKVKQKTDMGVLTRLTPVLIHSFKDELADFYKETLFTALKQNTGRNFYQNICSFLKTMFSNFPEMDSGEVLNEVKALYYNRPALIDEINRHFT